MVSQYKIIKGILQIVLIYKDMPHVSMPYHVRRLDVHYKQIHPKFAEPAASSSKNRRDTKNKTGECYIDLQRYVTHREGKGVYIPEARQRWCTSIEKIATE